MVKEVCQKPSTTTILIVQMGHEQTTAHAALPQRMSDEDQFLRASSQPGFTNFIILEQERHKYWVSCHSTDKDVALVNQNIDEDRYKEVMKTKIVASIDHGYKEVITCKQECMLSSCKVETIAIVEK